MKIAAIIQARMGSSRLPGKVMMKIQDIPMIEILLKRLSNSKLIDQIIVATTEEKDDHILYEYLINNGYKCEKGDTNNVLQRYLNVAQKYEADIVVRITGDCPLVDPKLIILTGSTAMRTILGINDSISNLRGKWIKKDGREIMTIFHPSYLLRFASKESQKPYDLTLKDLNNVRNKLNNL